jgi:hypothetical protein
MDFFIFLTVSGQLVPSGHIGHIPWNVTAILYFRQSEAGAIPTPLLILLSLQLHSLTKYD